MNRWTLAALALVITAWAAAPAAAQDRHAEGAASTADEADPGSMRAANEAYFAGDFAIAIARYEAIADAGIVHEELFYNLGNAYFRAAAGSADRLGRAVYNYERALRLAPTFEDARFNLDVARAAVAARGQDRLAEAEVDPFWIRQATRFSVAALCVALAVAIYLFFGALIVCRYQAAGVGRTLTLLVAGLSAVAAVGVALLLVAQLYFQNRVDMAIVLPDEIELREAPDPRSSERGAVHAGLRVRIVSREPGWLRVRLANGHEGWLSAGTVGEL